MDGCERHLNLKSCSLYVLISNMRPPSKSFRRVMQCKATQTCLQFADVGVMIMSDLQYAI